MMQLREYQDRAIKLLYAWFERNKEGNPVLNMPGGSGKSVVIASIVKDAIQNWPETRILMLVHSKELIAQNADKLNKIWRDAPLGIYSASIGKRQLGKSITFAGIQSIRNKAKLIGHIDLCLIDEAHSVSHKDEGAYRNLLSELLKINPHMRVIGLSASPYRLGHGLITDGENAVFSEIIEPVSIEELVYQKHLVPLRSKVTTHKLDANGIHKRNGDYIASEMEKKFNTYDNNSKVVLEILDKAKERKHWLIFCSGVEHSENVVRFLRELGIKAESLTSKCSKSERERKISEFESGGVRALCNVGILTTGYDFPALDCIVFLRSTMSPGLYLQMAVRGMRTCHGKEDCLVLDFAGVVQTHGPITAVNTPEKAGEGGGEAPIKVCDECAEIVHAAARKCPQCGAEFPEPQPKSLMLRNDCIMGQEDFELECSMWAWSVHTSRTSGKTMLKVTYYGNLSDAPIKEYLCINHDGYTGQRAMRTLGEIAVKSNAGNPDSNMLDSICQVMNQATPPIKIEYKKSGKFFEVTNREWL